MRGHEVSGATETIEAAPAKINLALHVTGQRADGYHLLETLVAFTEAGDTIRIRDADADSFSISGPFGDLLRAGDGGDNLVTRARNLLRDALASTGQPAPPVAIHLEKNLPVASGIGGGSADAAATLRGLLRHWRAGIAPDALASMALMLGADVPMCLESRSLIARGIGEDIEPLTDLPELPMVLANPLKAVSTPEIFRRLQSKTNPPLPASATIGWMDFLAQSRNDLQPPAQALLPEIGEIIGLLSQEGAALLRMSGSGATCFGIFHSLEAAREAETSLRQKRPGWYFQATRTI
ncbi:MULTISPECIES: 4-(cytidine 5'-diphospho)-2-C-methyl-D-erythritol kinase [unclassified Agrobacterium]|jgi:4-diphosphocytidyl-2-C-methyl-D-erythritol kinase|uniref:4-(cytidine 5'-diphospho)-2-C-methyl-D-erythritol kinase n=1 Tax=unclassified Agrobacterium TaxID=2632611 RepID=UPI00244B18FB|nr:MULTISPECIES: 4-(cytidine 5'-diphospho)-2-C-methyl-D-erythritol kinase [unclassified Agrobacterium]MDH0613246.1 4-(cytidine 5'-diphospho)-2-C-methyl-D-erythritol kinase [Agrobacterium sp. GD03872]MDH0695111.1 4-(cytidine 5'-diphospho)-2-C-methyl-D-erythritol kinase [Agrobacterium sp. GD03871]MDH1057491.1 4-(cytidine 5'-diphospho)-2-C-methyl-D-erythritol kinase [Agrobacterium sp. GD03992]MDH2208780.1 4-(cytidine 5'-diphospho)-2-C-methyl-D-erythritol kinase [Agrobacterium sp. GD03643]MDH22182